MFGYARVQLCFFFWSPWLYLQCGAWMNSKSCEFRYAAMTVRWGQSGARSLRELKKRPGTRSARPGADEVVIGARKLRRGASHVHATHEAIRLRDKVRCWAEHTTEHDDLRRVAAIEFQPGLDCYKALCDAVDPDNEFSEMEIKRYLFGDESAVLTNEYLAAFIEGARQFFLEGASKI